MTLDILGREKPTYSEGQRVRFDIDGRIKGEGRVCGRAIENVIDLWIVKVDPEFRALLDPKTYPWSCIVVPHTLMATVEEPAPMDLSIRPPPGVDVEDDDWNQATMANYVRHQEYVRSLSPETRSHSVQSFHSGQALGYIEGWDAACKEKLDALLVAVGMKSGTEAEGLAEVQRLRSLEDGQNQLRRTIRKSERIRSGQ